MEKSVDFFTMILRQFIEENNLSTNGDGTIVYPYTNITKIILIHILYHIQKLTHLNTNIKLKLLE